VLMQESEKIGSTAKITIYYNARCVVIERILRDLKLLVERRA